MEAIQKYRTSLLKAASAITEAARPQQFQLLLENISNVRNTMVVSGALASFGLAAIAGGDLSIPTSIKFLFQLSEVCFLLATLTYAFYLKEHIAQGMLTFKKFKEDGTVDLHDQLNLINQRLDGKISAEEFKVEKQNLLLKMEKTHLRTLSPQKNENEVSPEKWLGDSANFFLISGFILLIISILWFAVID
jgi:hypothetical protein